MTSLKSDSQSTAIAEFGEQNMRSIIQRHQIFHLVMESHRYSSRNTTDTSGRQILRRFSEKQRAQPRWGIDGCETGLDR